MDLVEVKSEITGSVWKTKTEVGSKVENEDVVIIIESMKMEIPLMANVEGVVKELKVKEGDTIYEGETVVVIETNK